MTKSDALPRDDYDFTLWFKGQSGDPNDFVSLFVRSERARQWCLKNDIDESTTDEMDNEEAWALREKLETAGFLILGVS